MAMTMQAATAASVVHYVAALWERTPPWVLSPRRTPDQVEARALVVLILMREHGYGVTAAGRVIGRDHSTAGHLYHTFGTRPDTADLVTDYRRAQTRPEARA